MASEGRSTSPVVVSPASRIVSLVLRIFTFILLSISLIVICTNTETKRETYGYYVLEIKYEFIKVKAYQYMLATIVIGVVYFLMQIGLSIYNVIMKDIGSLRLDFFGDKITSYVLATGAAAGFGVTVDGKKCLELNGAGLSTFYEKAYASASLLLIAFVCTAVLSVLSSMAVMPKPAN